MKKKELKVKIKQGLFTFLKMGIFPSFLYLIIFCILTYPLIRFFSTHFFSAAGDGLLSIWNIWWVNKAVTQLHQSPLYTSYFNFPDGISLIPHSLLFNGLFGVALLKIFNIVQTYNFIIIFSFIFSGFTAFLLAYYFSKSYWGSIIAGFIFTFSNYHFSQFIGGHLNLISFGWIPLFILCFYIFLQKPKIWLAIISSILLFLIILCDYYYFFYSILAAVLIIIWYAIKKRDACFFVKKDYLLPFLFFCAISILTSGFLVISFLILNMKNPLMVGHNSREFSLDFLAFIIPGGNWRFANLTQSYWSKLPGNIYESSVHLGIPVLFILVYTWIKGRNFKERGLWYSMFVFFFIMALGPVLHVWGKEISVIKLPYLLFEKLFPLLTLSGLPVRMVSMIILSASVISAIGFKKLFRHSWKTRILSGILILILFFEYLPAPIPTFKKPIPEYINVLKNLPDKKGVIDTTNNGYLNAYYQTIHEKPLVFCYDYVARVSKSIYQKEQKIKQTIADKQYSSLWHDYKVRYFITDVSIEIFRDDLPIKTIYQDDKVKLYDLSLF